MMIKVATATVGLFVALAVPVKADTLKSQDGTLQLTLPNGWRETKTPGPAIKISATSGRGALVMVRTVPKEDFVDFKSFASAGIGRFKKNMPDADPTVEDISINGTPAIRATLTGTEPSGLRKAFVLTFLNANGMFINVITSVNMSAFDAEKQAMQGMAAQLKIVGGPPPAAPSPAAPSPAAPSPAAPSPAAPAPAAPATPSPPTARPPR
jgi:hypothetical protein